MSPPPRVGIGVLVIRDGRVLIGERRGAHGAGAWALPGGALEPGETPEACAARELREETGLAATHFSRGPWVDSTFPDAGRWITLFLVAHDAEGDPVVREPTKCAGWAWHRWHDLPRPLFAPLAALHADGYTPGPPTDPEVSR